MSTGSQLSLLIPFFNERDNLPFLFESILRVSWPWPIEMVLVDDCSRDGSWEVLQQVLNQKQKELQERNIQCVTFRHDVNRGKGVAVHKAISLSAGQVLIVQDADGEYDPCEIPKLVNPILEGRADVVFGSRFRQNVNQAHRTYHYLVNRFLTLLSNLASGLHLTDMETCYKAFRGDILRSIQLRSKRFGFEPEITAHLARLKLIVWELPISYYPRSYIEGKKITWKDGLAALWHIIHFNFFCSYEDRFFSSMPKRFLLKKYASRVPLKNQT